MRITWHRGDHDETRPEPAWVTGRPVETSATLRIQAPKAGDLVHHDDAPHVAA